MPKEPSYRWAIVAAVAAILGIAMGQLINGFSVFFLPIEAETGWPRGDIAAINSAGLIGIGIGGIAMGHVADRADIRRLALFAGVVVALASLAASRATQLWHFYVIYFLAGALGGGALFAPLIALVGAWFRSGAGLAIGIASAGQAVGQGGVPYGAAFLIEQLGWRGALLALGVISFATLVPLAMLLRRAPPTPAASAAGDPGGSLLPPAVVLPAMCLAALGCCTGMSVPLMHLVPLICGGGSSAPQAGAVLFTLMIAAIFGRVAFGRLADMIGAIPAYMAAVTWQTVFVFGFTQIATLDTFQLYAPIYGFGYGGVMTGLLVTTRELTPAARRASMTGLILAFAWLGHSLGGWQGGALYDLTGRYDWGFGNAAIAGLVNLAVVGSLGLALHRRRRRGLVQA
jgi:MFS family permease